MFFVTYATTWLRNEGTGTFSDSQWPGLIHRGCNKPRFQYCVDSNNNLLHICVIQGHSGGDLIDPQFPNYVAVPLGGRQTVFTALDPTGDEIDEEYENLTKPQKYITKASGLISGRNLLDQFGKSTKKRITILADLISRHYPLWLGVCWLHWESGKHQGGQNFVSEASWSATASPKCVEKCLVSTARQRSTATIKHRGIVCGTDPFKIDIRVQGVPRKCRAWRSRTNDQDSKRGAYSQKSVQNGVNNLWFWDHPSKAYKRSNYSSWVKYLPRFNAHSVPNIVHEDVCITPALNASGL